MFLIKTSLGVGVLLIITCGIVPSVSQSGPTPQSTSTPTPSPTPTPSTTSRIAQWFCRTFGFDTKVYEKLSRVRGKEAARELGSRVMKLDLRTQQETELWACGGCWSPARLNETSLVVLKGDGIWLVPPAPGTPLLVLAADNLIAIIGTLPQRGTDLLVIARTNDTQCPYALQIADVSTTAPLASRRLQTPPGSPPACFSGINDLAGIIKASRTRNDLALSDSRREGQRLNLSHLQKKLMRGDDPQPEPLTPQVNGRFSPNWWNDNEIIFVAVP